MSNVVEIRRPAAAVEPEPLEAAVREVSARMAANNEERRSLHSRLDVLRGLSPSLRRSRPRLVSVAPARAGNFYSIEEAAAEDAAPLQVA